MGGNITSQGDMQITVMQKVIQATLQVWNNVVK